MTNDEARATVLEELNSILACNVLPHTEIQPTALVGSALVLANRLTAAAMAAHVVGGYEWPVVTHGPIVEALGELGSTAPAVGMWTVGVQGHFNTSKKFEELVTEVADVISNSSHDLINGSNRRVANLIVARLAHRHGMAPNPEPV